MLRLITAASILALSSPALAQNAVPLDTPPQDSSAAPNPESTDTPMADSSVAPAAETAPSSAEPSKEMQVKQVVEANFPTYDSDQSGDLNAAEFDGWLTVLREKSAQAKGTADTMAEPEKKTWMKAAFAKADADKSKKISKSELETFLLG